ncbi:hypothetical protein [Saliniramus sp.]|uniref:hypothetical protein n=1 Tax=Saliniramus sp. TaxID=2986772 RepID=UPI002BA3DD67|nr:hypothetical protein [Saliniramus sp.]HMB11540.1 hypothetical protein [Saliniramus sp.]
MMNVHGFSSSDPKMGNVAPREKTDFSLPPEKSAQPAGAIASGCVPPGSQSGNAPIAIPLDSPFTDFIINQAARNLDSPAESLVLSDNPNGQNASNLQTVLQRVLGTVVREDGLVAIVQNGDGYISVEEFRQLSREHGTTFVLSTGGGNAALVIDPNQPDRMDRGAVIDDGDVHSGCGGVPSIRLSN